MSVAISRMEFLRGDFTARSRVTRPPWALDETLFTSICNGCGECIETCPTKIIHKGRGNFPAVDFKNGECLFCGDCVDACKPRALKKINEQSPWLITANINNKTCLAYSNVECRSCYDPCEARAISMIPRVGGVSIPLINTKQCNGCGACYAVCPSQAISIKQQIQESS